MIVIGLTGSIGMGKSTAAKMLAEMGIPCHDADATVHELMGPGGKAVEPIAKLCPDALATDAAGAPYIDRKKLGAAFFASPELKAQVEGVLFPLVRESSDNFVKLKEKEGCRAVVLDIPLLFEVGRDKDVDVTIVVSAPKEVQRERVLARGTTQERLDAVLASQLPDAEKRSRADYVVETHIGLDDTKAQLKAIVAKLLPPPKSPPPKFCL
ncbi:MAG TPA: dephospho-CoA kinase [Patescibacteria group bacterium]|nr:dephospho-CoA kinase [Patescibacteria group bacterium]